MKLRIAGLVLTIIPAAFLLLMGIGEMTSGIISGIQHIPEFAILALLIFWAWKKPRIGSVALIAFALLFALFFGALAYNNGRGIAWRFLVGILMLDVPIMLGATLFYFSSRFSAGSSKKARHPSKK